MTNLYKTKGSRFVESDICRGRKESYNEYTDDYIVVADSNEQARERFLDYKSSSWEICSMKELKNESDLPLEKRLNILKEVFPVIEKEK